MVHFCEKESRCQRCGKSAEMDEPEYDVVDDQEEVHSMRILPARPMYDDREYAGPAVNRNLKPGRRKTRLDRSMPLEPKDHESLRSSLPSEFILELSRNISGLRVHEPSRKDRQLMTTEEADSSLHLKEPQATKSVSAHLTHQRHSLDLETHDFDKRTHHDFEWVPSQRHHHEWPQTKEDQSDFVPVEKPNTFCEEDWYVGACNRADAEHALHLVNKDGAFLVRDCSIITNSEPLVLVVYHEKKVYNVKIRFVEATRRFVLGTRHRSNDMFDTVAEMIKFHSIFPITLIGGRNTACTKYPENCVLTSPITKSDVEQLLQ